MEKKIVDENQTVTKAIIKNEKQYHPIGNKKSSIYDSTMKDHKKNILLLKRKGLSDEKLVRYFVENKNEEAFDEIVKRYTDKI